MITGKTGKFRRGSNAGTRWCYCCRRHVQAARFDDDSTDLCVTCFNSASMENEHNDYGHDEREKDCPVCMDVGCLHEMTKPTTRSKAMTTPRKPKTTDAAHNGAAKETTMTTATATPTKTRTRKASAPARKAAAPKVVHRYAVPAHVREAFHAYCAAHRNVQGPWYSVRSEPTGSHNFRGCVLLENGETQRVEYNATTKKFQPVR